MIDGIVTKINHLPIDIVFLENLTYSQNTDIAWLQINTSFSTK